MRAKLKCQSISIYEGAYEANLSAVYADGDLENASFSSTTPSANLRIMITNPLAYDFFKPGECYYLDFTPAPKTKLKTE